MRYCDSAGAHALSFVNINSHDLVEIWNYREYKLKFPGKFHAAIRINAVTSELITDLPGRVQSIVKLSSIAAFAISLRTSEKAK